jgi:hypothetical protein
MKKVFKAASMEIINLGEILTNEVINASAGSGKDGEDNNDLDGE